MITLLAASTLAGCFGADDATTSDAALTDAEGADGSEVSRAAAPDNRTGALVAFEETNATEEGAGGLDHRHDDWAGRERITILERSVNLQARTTNDGRAWAEAPIPLGIGPRVFEGTRAVELTFSDPQRRACQPLLYSDDERVCSDGVGGAAPDPTGGPTGITLFFRDAIASEWIDAGEVSWTDPMVISITDPRQTDMPHSAASLWAFRLYSSDASLDTLKLSLRIDIVRGEGDIPLWPGHPDFYVDGDSRVVLQGSATRTMGDPADALSTTSAPTQALAPEKLISYGTRALHVFVNITRVASPNPAATPTAWTLEWHNASGYWLNSNATDPAHAGDVLEHVFVIPVDDNAMDSPYASASRWSFRLGAQFAVRQEGVTTFTCTGMCAAYEVDYDLVVIATSQPPPESPPT